MGGHAPPAHASAILVFRLPLFVPAVLPLAYLGGHAAYRTLLMRQLAPP
jgi:hypothetical protein